MGLCPFLPYFLKVPFRAEGPNGVRDRLVYESSTGHFYFEFCTSGMQISLYVPTTHAVNNGRSRYISLDGSYTEVVVDESVWYGSISD